MKRKSIIKSKIWIILAVGVILLLIGLLRQDSIQNVYIGLGTGIITSFIVGMIVEVKHEMRDNQQKEIFRANLYDLLFVLLESLFSDIKYFNFECTNVKMDEFFRLIKKLDDEDKLDKDSLSSVFENTSFNLKEIMAHQNINVNMYVLMGIISESEGQLFLNLFYRIKKLDDCKRKEMQSFLLFPLYEAVQAVINNSNCSNIVLFKSLIFSTMHRNIEIGLSADTLDTIDIANIKIEISDDCPIKEKLISGGIFDKLITSDKYIQNRTN